MIGTILDKYEVLQKVGEGGMATVYRGRHTTLNRDVAIKVLHPHLSSSTRNRKRFAREARAIEHLRHDNILEIFDYSGANAEDCYIVTEFVGGRTLSGFMDEHGKLPSEVATIIGLALADALAYAHDSAVLHRDLKPDNVMIRYDGTVKLMDFGIARFLDESQVTMTGALVGSPSFMSPEQAREGDLDLRSDLFSLGTLLFFLASGHLPFAGSNPSLILKNIIEGNRPHLQELAPSVSSTLADVVERLLQTDREERFDDARQVSEQLQLALAEVDVDPSSPRWSLCAWLEDPDAYARDLDDHLRDVLLAEGRRQLEAGESLAALRLLNRLLAIDEDNAEVLALVQGLHRDEPRRRAAPWVLAGVAVVLAASAFLVVGVLTGALPIPGLSTEDPDRTAVGPEPDPGASAALSTTGETEDPEAGVVVADTDAAPGDTDAPEAGTDTPEAPAVGRDDGVSGGGTGSPGTRSPLATAVRLPPGPPAGSADDTDESAAAGTAEPELPKVGYLEIRLTQDTWASVRIDGQPAGWRTNDPGAVEVQPGNHIVTLTNPLARDKELEVTVAPGETVTRRVSLDFDPLPIDVPRDWDKRCKVRLDGVDVGTLAEMSYQLSGPRRLDGYEVILDCPGGGATRLPISKRAVQLASYTLPAPE